MKIISTSAVLPHLIKANPNPYVLHDFFLSCSFRVLLGHFTKGPNSLRNDFLAISLETKNALASGWEPEFGTWCIAVCLCLSQECGAESMH